MRMIRLTVLTLAVAAMLAGSAMAQQRPQPGQGRGGPGGPGGPGDPGARGLGLLMAPAVQEELKLSEEQLSQLRTAASELRSAQPVRPEGLRDLAPEERREAMEKMRAEAEERTNKILADILKPEQRERFEQIQLQTRGVLALMDPEVAEKLGLSDEQKEQIETTVRESRTEMARRFQRGGGDPGAAMERIRAAQLEIQEKAMNVLTSEQKETWNSLVGSPVEIGPQGGRGAGGRGPGGEAGPGGRRPGGEGGPGGRRPGGDRP